MIWHVALIQGHCWQQDTHIGIGHEIMTNDQVPIHCPQNAVVQ